MNIKENLREFKLTTAALKNSNTIYLLIIILVILGLISYRNMPKEMFPDASLPTILVQTVYPGNSSADMENLVSRPLEKEIETIDGINSLESTSSQDNSIIIVELDASVKIEKALQDVKDAVDRALGELPEDLPADPFVSDIDVSEFPIVNVNLSGDFSVPELKKYAEFLEEKIEELPQISKVNIKGVEDRMVHLPLDKSKMDAFKLTFTDIENAVAYENMSVSGGDIIIDGIRRSVRTNGEFNSVSEIESVVVKSEKGKSVYLRDVLAGGKAIDGFAEPLSVARLGNETVVSVQVIKKTGENLIIAVEQIFQILDNAKKKNELPETIRITVTNDQSDMVKGMIKNLENNIIMGVLFVMFVLFFFLGTRNAMFVGFSIPMSMLISFLVLTLIGSTINMMVLFGLILALGLLVDNAIVAVENIHRFMHRGYSRFEAAKLAVGEIAWPIIASTATTLAAFIPLAMWPGMIGKFMKFLPITLIIVLSSSLFTALVLIPVLTRSFSRKTEERPPQKRTLIISGIGGVLAVMFYVTGVYVLANLLLIIAVITMLNRYFFFGVSVWFRKVFLIKLEYFYLRVIKYTLRGKRPVMFLLGTVGIMLLTISIYFMSSPKVEFFPVNEPKYINVQVELPVGVDLPRTDSTMQLIEKDINRILDEGDYGSIVKSVLTTVGKGAVGEQEMAFGKTPHKGITTINFVDYQDREGINTAELRELLSHEIIGKYPGVTVTVAKNGMGPPTGKAINIELTGENYEELHTTADSIKIFLTAQNISGVEALRLSVSKGNPSMIIDIDRDKAGRFGLSTGQIASAIRTALFGKEISDYKVGEEEYPIKIQLSDKYRNNIDALLNQIITFRNKQGKFVHIPISSVADFSYSTSYGSIKRIDGKRVITIFSGITEGANANEINRIIEQVLSTVDLPNGIEYELTGEQQEQAETGAFLARAMMLAIGFILMIMITQFNSVVKPFIIIASVLFSTIGVFGGLATFQMNFVVIMTGVGIISLAGVVVNNAIVLIDYIDYLKLQRKYELSLSKEDSLPVSEIVKAIVKGGQTRLHPVLLTAITTILGLLPMAVGFNIDFEGLLSNFAPNIYFGGDNALFWGPMAWTVIFGLAFATFLTLVLVPVMYLMANRIKLYFIDKQKLEQ
ncbi:MAG: efflux RND transporter permease subunit [Bacteroidota bacterium]|nr:efflux RND transporter permease subunit [Bacteroidota bacterium]